MSAVWVSATRRVITGPAFLHAAGIGERAACGQRLPPEELWCAAGMWLNHMSKHRGCECVRLCGPCLYWAGWPTAVPA